MTSKNLTSVSTTLWVSLATLLALLIAASGFLTYGWTIEGAGAATRLTARLALPWFLLAWSASALVAFWPGGWRQQLLRRRRALGLSFAFTHFVHFAALTSMSVIFGREHSMVSLVGGGFTYVMITSMALTSNDQSIRWLGAKRWKALHSWGGALIALIFANSYMGRIESDPALGIPAFSAIIAVALLKIVAWRKRRGSRLTATA
jgi:methionine sulfoxide reductase heme-binding subunit